MKTTIASSLLATLAGLAGFSLTAAAQPDPKDAQVERRVLRVESDRAPGTPPAAVKEPVTFLGVETSPVSETVSSQLGLAEGTGLVVKTIVPGSPAVGVLKAHDILLKLNDQILIETRQLAVLIRQHKAGDEIALTIVRKGKEETVRVKLIQREMPKRVLNFKVPAIIQRLGNLDTTRSSPAAARLDGLRELGEEGDVQDVLRVIEDARSSGGQVHVYNRNSAAPTHASRDITIVNAAQSKVVYSDDEGTLELTLNKGAKSLSAKGKDGKVLFDGAVTSPEERAKIPEPIRARFEKMESMEGFSFTPDADFPGARVKLATPGSTQINFPLKPLLAPANPQI